MSVGVAPTCVCFQWPDVGTAANPEAFVGIWHPEEAVTVSRWPTDGRERTDTAGYSAGRNWALLSSVSRWGTKAAGLVHAGWENADRSRVAGVAFRGYVLGGGLHSYSSAADLVNYWTRAPLQEHNGVFASAIISGDGETITLVADALGLAPLYYAWWDRSLIFATSPQFLTTSTSVANLLAWRCLLETEFLPDGDTLDQTVHRLPAGQALVATRNGHRLVTVYDYEAFPAGNRRVDRAGIAQIEATFQQSMDRCLSLQHGRTMLPLSSGHDSRRILASLVHRQRDFEAVTCRVYHGRRDLDAHYASEMAQDLGFRHRCVDLPDVDEYVGLDDVRRRLLDAETKYHTWSMRLMQSLPSEPVTLLDGLAGDILGNPGFRQPNLYQSPGQDIEIILRASLRDTFRTVLTRRRWPTAAAVATSLRGFFKRLPQRVNLAEFAFLLTRIRRSTALQTIPLLPPGNLVLFPYLDLDYVRLMLQFTPLDKHAVVVQRQCLADFWPAYHRYPGTRNVPATLPTRISAAAERAIVWACTERLGREITAANGQGFLRQLLTFRGAVGMQLARCHPVILMRERWYLRDLLELVSREVRKKPCWSIAGGEPSKAVARLHPGEWATPSTIDGQSH